MYAKASTYDNENPFAATDGSNGSSSTTFSSSTMISTAATGNSTMEPPAWLKEPSNNNSSNNQNNIGNNNYNQSNADDTSIHVDKDVPRMILYTRIINLVLSVCMIVASLLSLLTTDNATTGVLACYVVVFSCLLCCFETHLKQIAKLIAFNFGFMYSAKSRSVFMIFVGTILFSFSLFGKIIGVLMLANAGFNIYVLFKYPGYEDAQRSDAQSEIKDYLAANPAFAQSVVSFGVQAGAAAAIASATSSGSSQDNSNNSSSNNAFNHSSSAKQAPPSSFTI